MSTDITDNQAETLLAIWEYLKAQDTPSPLPPSVRDLVPMIGVSSTSVVVRRIKHLVRDGYLKDDPAMQGISRAQTRLTWRGENVVMRLTKFANE